MSDYIPVDILSEILLKLPIKSIIRFTAVCKSWKSLIFSPCFIYAHLSHTKNHSILRRYEEYDKCDDDCLELKITTSYKGCFEICYSWNSEIPFISETVSYGIVGSCDGIVCLKDFFLNSLQPIILWNSSVRNHVVLPLSQAITNPKEPQLVVLGFGVANHVYKVVRLVYSRKPDDHYFAVPPLVEIFSIGTTRWRSVCGFDIKLRVPPSLWRQVLLEGIIHWLGYEPNDDRSYRISILTFDLSDEVFGEVMLPDVLALAWGGVTKWCLYKIGESLAVVKSGSYLLNDACDVWVMKEYGVKGSWTNLYSIDFAEECKDFDMMFEIVGFKNGEALLAYHEDGVRLEWPELYSYNLETKQSKDLRTVGTPRWFYIDDYVESLLLLKGNSVPAVEEIGEPMERLNIKE